jgi:5'-nucleotidase
MHILLCNDDGYTAEGLRCLATALARRARVTVVAPDRDRSGSSNSLTLDRPLRAERQEDGVIKVDGTPTDCVHLALTGLLDAEPSMVVSGINSGPNLGDDVIYSGTVAAAMEGRFLGLPAIAVSMGQFGPAHYASGVNAVLGLLERLSSAELPPDTILNVNVPDLPWAEIRGFAATRLGHRHRAEPVVAACDPRGRTIYWVGQAGPEQDAGPGTDFAALRGGYVSVTPIHVDLTRHQALPSVAAWLTPANTP